MYRMAQGGQSSNEVLTGEISALFATAPTSLQHIEKGTIIALASSGEKGVSQLPNLAPLSATVPGFDVVEWQGLVGPPGMPRNILDA